MTTEADTRALVPAQNVSLGTLQAESAGQMVAAATEMARELAAIIERQKLFSTIQGRKFTRVEGWQTLATMMGCLPREVANEEQEDGSFIAHIELVRINDGTVLSSASALCGDPTDRTWANRPKYARRSMAATRATSKACRLAFAWVMVLAGYQPTPAEEMEEEPNQQAAPAKGPGPTQAQLKRLFAIAKDHDWGDDALKQLITFKFRIDSSKQLSRAQYDELCDEILPAGPPKEGDLLHAGDGGEPPY